MAKSRFKALKYKGSYTQMLHVWNIYPAISPCSCGHVWNIHPMNVNHPYLDPILTWPMAKLKTFWDYIFSRENKVQTFILGFHSLSEMKVNHPYMDPIRKSISSVGACGSRTGLCHSTCIDLLLCRGGGVPKMSNGFNNHGNHVNPSFLGVISPIFLDF